MVEIQHSKQSYFALDSETGNVQLFVSISACVKVLNLNLKTIQNGISLNRSNQTTAWINFSMQGVVYVLYESIPLKSINRAGLPKNSHDAFAYLQGMKPEFHDVFKNIEYLQLEMKLKHHYQIRFAPYIKHYKEKIKDPKKRIQYAKVHSLFEHVIDLRSKGTPEAAIFHAVTKLFKEEILDGRKPIFYTPSARTFFNKTRAAVRSGSIKDTIMNKHLGVPRPEQRKVTEEIAAYIRDLMRNPKRLTLQKIRSKVRKKFNIELGKTRIHLIRDQETKNLTSFVANGAKYSRNNSIPKLDIEVGAPGEMFIGDYYHVQFICRRADGEIIRVIVYHVIDGFSKKVLGWAMEQVKSEQSALSAFRQAIVDCNFLPEEIRIDNDPFYKTPLFREFLLNIQDLGVIVDFSTPGLATYNSIIESFHASFQKRVCSDLDFYLGESVASRNIAGNPSKELIDKYYNQINKIPFYDDFKFLYREMIIKYNSSEYD